jgi:beta-N-acetylhexosaminidase
VQTDDAHVYRRRRLAAIAAAVAFVIAAILIARGCGDGAGETAPPDPLAGVSAAELVGQRLMVRMGDGVTPALLGAARRGEIGGVILFPAEGADPAAVSDDVSRLQRSAAAGGNPPLLVATDQEGGEVKRFLDAPPDLSPSQLGAEGDPAEAVAQGTATGEFLAGVGANVDLAPVLDVPSEGSFMESRAFSGDASVVAGVGVAFAKGLAAAGVAATAKHFPGLGMATVNTDEASSAVAASRAELRAGLEPFEAAIAAGVGLVMVANATYPAFDPDAPAVLSERIVGDELRGRLGYDGVVITDDLEAPSIGSVLAAPDAAVEAARAGADVLLFATGADPRPIHARMLRALQEGLLERTAMEESYVRISNLKAAVSDALPAPSG